MGVKSYDRIREWKEPHDSQADMARALKKKPSALHEQRKHGRSIDLTELPLLRPYAHGRGMTDKQLLDVLCEEGRDIAAEDESVSKKPTKKQK